MNTVDTFKPTNKFYNTIRKKILDKLRVEGVDVNPDKLDRYLMENIVEAVDSYLDANKSKLIKITVFDLSKE